MESRLVLDVQKDLVNIALLEDGRLVELNKESREEGFTVGNIYLARVKKLLPGLNAAFIDVGYKREGFLHCLDLGPTFPTIAAYTKIALDNRRRTLMMNKISYKGELPKQAVINDVLVQGMEILVQVAKEPISTKGPRLTAEISLAGRFLVLLPFHTKVSISHKIKSSSEKNRLRKLVQAAKPANYGVIIRTVAEGRKKEEIENELAVLVARWEAGLDKLRKVKKTPELIIEEISRAETILRDHLNSNYQSIHINDQSVYEDIKSYLTLIEPEKSSMVKYYDEPVPIFDTFNITRQIKALFGRIVTLRKGAYLVVEHTEALHVIDVNSGIRSKGMAQEENACEVNMMAVDEVARQLRLRDMGGIVIIDLIDMQKSENKKAVYERMRANLENDSAEHCVLPLSKFGLMEITRKRVRPETFVDTQEQCPTCLGTGKIRPSIIFTDFLERKVEFVRRHLHYTKTIRLYVHPFVYAYLKQGLFNESLRWKFRYGFSLKLYPDQSLAFLQYRFIDKDGNEINLSDKTEMVL